MREKEQLKNDMALAAELARDISNYEGEALSDFAKSRLRKITELCDVSTERMWS